MPGRVGDANNDINKTDSRSVGQISDDIKLMVHGKIIEALTRAEIGNAKNMVGF